MRALLPVLVLAACDPGERSRDTTPDAATSDAWECVDQTPYVPVDVTGSSPSGSLAAFTQLYGIWYPCNLYEVVLTTGSRCDEDHRELRLQVPGADPGQTVAAQLMLVEGASGAPTGEASGQFHVLRLAVDGITGQFVFANNGWTLELRLDVEPSSGASCTL